RGGVGADGGNRPRWSVGVSPRSRAVACGAGRARGPRSAGRPGPLTRAWSPSENRMNRRTRLIELVDDGCGAAKEGLAQDEAHGKSGEEDLAGVFLRPRADLPRRFLGIVAAELQATPERLRFLRCGGAPRCDSRHR